MSGITFQEARTFFRLAFGVVRRNAEALETIRYLREGGKHRFLTSHPLGPSSVVFDVGGYLGEWTEAICHRYDPTVYVFEPVPAFMEILRGRLERNPKVKLFAVGLGSARRIVRMPLNGPATAAREDGTGPECQIVRFADFLREAHIPLIDLIAINIEGGEYDLLPHMIEENIVARCANLLIQFHGDFSPWRERRDEIRRRLEETHFLTFQYRNFWENWRRRLNRGAKEFTENLS